MSEPWSIEMLARHILHVGDDESCADLARCPKCGRWSPVKEWHACLFECELGCDHWRVECALCGHEFDEPWSPHKTIQVEVILVVPPAPPLFEEGEEIQIDGLNRAPCGSRCAARGAAVKNPRARKARG